MRKVCVYTGSRAEYGLLRPLVGAIDASSKLELQLLVAAMHLAPEFGMTVDEIEADGVAIAARVDCLGRDDNPAGISASFGRCAAGCGVALQRLDPHLVVILGDRFDALAAAVAATNANRPIAHLHGGEASFGATDDAFRHAISKMSHLHFTATDEYRRRVIQLGEAPERVFNVGAIGLDSVRSLSLLGRATLERQLGTGLGERNLLVTYHPATREPEAVLTRFELLLDALGELEGVKLLFTKANADAGGRTINARLDEWISEQPEQHFVTASLGQLRYLSLMKLVDGVVGNSSSGIIEAASFGVGTLNVGNRQDGRIRPDSVIDCDEELGALKAGLATLLSDDFRAKARAVKNPYGDGHTTERIMRVLESAGLADASVAKRFYDLPQHSG